jgi:glycine betaine/proline transport system ATP-binding protein
VTLLAALGNVSPTTGEVPVIEPPARISMSIITETLRDTAPEGVQP